VLKQADHPLMTGDVSYMQIVWPPLSEWIDFEKSAFECVNRDDNTSTPMELKDGAALTDFIGSLTWPTGIRATKIMMNVPSLSAVFILNLMPIQISQVAV
jgi:hypothetical protein